MSNLLKPGPIAGILTLAGAIALAAKHPALAAFFNDPQTATTLSTVAIGAVGLVAGFLKGWKH